MEDCFSISFKELTKKTVINICDGKKLGNIFDAEIDMSCNKIIFYLVRDKKIEFFKRECCYKIFVKDIKKIGNEIILVEKAICDDKC